MSEEQLKMLSLLIGIYQGTNYDHIRNEFNNIDNMNEVSCK